MCGFVWKIHLRTICCHQFRHLVVVCCIWPNSMDSLTFLLPPSPNAGTDDGHYCSCLIPHKTNGWFNIFLSYSFYEFLRRLLQYDNHPMLKQQSTLLFPFGIALVARVERCHQKVILHVMEFPTKHFISLHMVFEGWNNSPLVFVPLFEMHFHVVYFHNFLFQLSQFNCHSSRAYFFCGFWSKLIHLFLIGIMLRCWRYRDDFFLLNF